MNKREIGTRYEEEACAYLEKNGVLIKERNFRCRQGEIDIVGTQEGYLVFFEVKYRATDKGGLPEEAVNYAKQKKICRTGDYYRMLHGYSDDRPVRYDVIGISGRDSMEIRWYKNAFPHIYRENRRK